MFAVRRVIVHLVAISCAILFIAWADPPSSRNPATRAGKSHWAYAPLTAPAVPVTGDDSPRQFTRNAIDRFILAELGQHNLGPAAEADRRTLVHRIYFDLLGLPPAPEAVDEFLNDASPNAYEKLVDRALASPHFGERLAMVWLDLVRYGDTNGYHADVHRNVFPYRDY